MRALLLFGDSARSPALRHEVPIAVMDPFLFAEVDGRPLVLTSFLERDRIAAALEDADIGDERFDEVFAINVAPFWLQPKEALGIVRRHLAPDGAVYLFWDARHTEPGRARDLADRLSERIRLAEFSVNQVLVKDLRPVPAVCVVGRPQGG